jgi:DNA polymerase
MAELAVQDPASVAAETPSLDMLARAACRCVACPELAATRTSVVPGDFPPAADVLLVGEAPGAQEDATGRPFVGKAGQLLDRLLVEVGLPRERVAVTNVVKCRPPANRKPRRPEVARCRSWLERQVMLADPVVVCTLGGTAAEWALGPGTRLGAARELSHTYAGRPLVVTFHPSAAIRFGPRGAPLAALRTDLATLADLAASSPRSPRPAR